MTKLENLNSFSSFKCQTPADDRRTSPTADSIKEKETYVYKADSIWHLLGNLCKQPDHTEQDDKVFGHSVDEQEDELIKKAKKI